MRRYKNHCHRIVLNVSRVTLKIFIGIHSIFSKYTADLATPNLNFRNSKSTYRKNFGERSF